MKGKLRRLSTKRRLPSASRLQIPYAKAGNGANLAANQPNASQGVPDVLMLTIRAHSF